MCKQLSLWWTAGVRDDVFWRTSNSGGRSKVRSRGGRGTFGQYGDIQATDPIGQPLVDLCTIELKRGYKHTIGDVLDAPTGAIEQQWEGFTRQAAGDAANAGAPFWLLITRRNQRAAVVFMPELLYRRLNDCGACLNEALPKLRFTNRGERPPCMSVYATPLDEFLALVTRDSIVKARQI